VMYWLIVALLGQSQGQPLTGFDYPRQMYTSRQGCEIDARRVVKDFVVYQSDDKEYKRAALPSVVAYCIPHVDPRKPGG